MKKDTRLIHAGRSKKYTGSVVNPPVVRASTIVFDTFAELRHGMLNRGNGCRFMAGAVLTRILHCSRLFVSWRAVPVVRFIRAGRQRSAVPCWHFCKAAITC